MKKGNAIALLPILVFLVLYLGCGILFEYVLKIPMGFYNIPIVVVFLVALTVACFQNRNLSFDDKLTIMGRGMSEKTIVTMVLIFMAAGVFVGTVGRSSADSVAYFLLSIIPPQYAVVMLFVIACFVSLAMGTSVGTITLITPIAVAVSSASSFSLPLCVATVMGGAMFGDNLSFISDTTIAACQGQGCAMQEKFKENFKIALPAALATLLIIWLMTVNAGNATAIIEDYNLIQLVPYVLVLALAIAGINVFVVLIIGVLTGSAIMLFTGATTPVDLIGSMGTGCAGMFETTMVALLVSAICALVREYGGFETLLNVIRSLFKSKKGGMLGMGLLVGCMDISTANNTVAIVIANPIATDMAKTYNISRRKTASLLDTFSCVFQGVIPYGAQMLVALGAVTDLGLTLSAFDVIPLLFYPFMLLLSSLVFIFLIPDKRGFDDSTPTQQDAAETAEPTSPSQPHCN